MRKKLIALYPILYQAKQYAVGDELPTNNNDMTEKWVKGGSAKWNDYNSNETKSPIAVVTEEYENKIADIEEKYKAEIEKITAERDEALNKYNELLKSQAFGNLEKKQDINPDEIQNENAEVKSEQSSKTTKTKNASKK